MKPFVNRSLLIVARLVAVLPPVLLLVLAVILVVRHFQASRGELLELLTGELGRSFDITISIDDVDASVPGNLVAEGISVSKPGFGLLARAGQVRVRYSLTVLAAGYRDPASAIRSVEVIDPVLRIRRDRDGRLNLIEAFRPKVKKPRGKPFQALVTVRNASATYFDERPLTGTRPMSVALTGLDATADFRSGEGASFRGTARSTNVSGALDFNGAFDYRGALALSSDLTRVSGPFIDQYFIPGEAVHISRGTASGEFSVTVHPGGKPATNFWVSADVRGADLQLARGFPPIRDVNGRVQMAGTDALMFDVTARAESSPLTASGTIANLAEPVLWVDAALRSVDYRRVLAALPSGTAPAGLSASGTGPVKLQVRGPLSAPGVSGDVFVPQLAYQGYSASGVAARFAYSGREIRLEASAEAGGGRLAASGGFEVSPRLEGAGEFRFARVDLSEVNADFGGTASGSGSFRFDDGRPVGRVEVSVADPSAYGRTASSVRAQVDIEPTRAVIESLLVSTPGGFLTASGPVGFDGALDLSVAAVGLSLQSIAGPTVEEPIAGTLDTTAAITGTTADPSFEGQVQVLDMRYGGESFDLIAGLLTASRREAATEGLTIVRGLSEATLSGRVEEPLAKDPIVDLTASVKAFDLQEVAGYVPALEALGGRASGEISVQGPVSSVRAAFDLDVEGARYQAYNAPAVSVTGAYDDGSLTISELTAVRGPASLSASGSLGKGGTLDFSFAVTDLPVTDVLLLAMGRHLPVSGSLDIAGNLGGNASSPEFRGQIEASDVNIAGDQVGVAGGTLVWQNGILSLEDTALQVAGGTVAIEDLAVRTGGDESGLLSAALLLGEAAEGVEGASDVEVGRALGIARGLGLFSGLANPSLRDTLATLPEQVEGGLRGSLTAVREPAGLVIQANVEGSRIRAYDAPLGNIALDARAGPDGYTVDSLILEDDQMRIAASGRLSADEVVAADVEGNNVPLARIPALQRLTEAEGAADFSFTVEGTLDQPEARGSLLISDATIAGIEVERFTTGLVTADADSVDFSESTLVSAGHSLRFQGSIPFSIAALAFVDGGDITMSAELVNPDLDILGIVMPRVDPDRTSGDLQAVLSVSGQWPQPELQGSLQLEDGELGIVGVETVFRDIDIDVFLLGREVRVNRFQMASSNGGRLEITGGAALGESGWAVDAAANANDFGLVFRNVSQRFNESFDGKLDIALTASGPLRQPLIAGRVLAHQGYIGLPEFPEEPAAASQVAWSPEFNITLEAGREMRVRAPRLNVGVRGQVAIGRTLRKPLVTGTLEVINGYLLFPGSRFRVVPTGGIAFLYDPPDATRVTLDIRAQTTISTAAATGPGGGSYRVEMAMRGSLENPDVRFQSDPPGLDRGRILALLGQQAGVGPTGFQAGAQFEQEVARLFTASVAPSFLEPIELALAEALGFQEVAIGFGGRWEPLNVQISRRLFDGVSITYWRTVAAGQEQDEWKFSYQITDRLRANYGQSRFGANFVGIEGMFSF